MFIEGFCLGSIIFIIAMVFIPWKSCGRQNIKVSELSTSTNKQMDAIALVRKLADNVLDNDVAHEDFNRMLERIEQQHH